MARYMMVINGEPRGYILWDAKTPLDVPGATFVPEASWPGPDGPPRPVEEVHADSLRSKADSALGAMQAHVDRGTFTAGQRDNALLLVLRVCIALTRLTLGRLERD